MDMQKLILHARFAPNGTVVEISERPEGLTPQAWFNFSATRPATSTRRLPAAAACSA